jgi:hypothetical protein
MKKSPSKFTAKKKKQHIIGCYNNKIKHQGLKDNKIFYLFSNLNRTEYNKKGG